MLQEKETGVLGQRLVAAYTALPGTMITFLRFLRTEGARTSSQKVSSRQTLHHMKATLSQYTQD